MRGIALSPAAALSYLYQAVVTFRGWGYRRGLLPRRALSIPVLSVGNLTVGGTGKTPAVLFLARWLQQRGRRVAVLSRGYKGTAGGSINVVSDGKCVLLSPREAGDEPFLLARRLPGVAVLTASDRSRAGTYAQDRLSADIALLDDGFQHLRLRRNVDIVLLDAERPFGNGYVLPRGPLREPPSSLARAHIALVTSADGKNHPAEKKVEEHIHRHHPTIPIFHAHYVPGTLTTLDERKELPLDCLQGRQVVAVAGIGRPESFSRLLRNLGARVAETRFFPDHHHYRAGDLAGLPEDTLPVTTEKDAVKLRCLENTGKTILVLSVSLAINREDAFAAALKKCLPYAGL